MTAEYAELHCHSALSLLDGASNPEDLVARAHELGYPALALTDHDELGAAVRFAQAADEAGINAIIGAELTVDIEDPALVATHTHLVLLAESREGYGNLSTLITRARMDRPRGDPSVPLDLLARHARGLFALTGCVRGWVPALLARGRGTAARAAASTLADIFERRIAIECWDHGLPEERALVRRLIPLARSLDLPWVVTNDVHYARAEGRLVHDVLCAIRHQRTLDEMGTRLRPNDEWCLASPEHMRQRWRHAPEGLRATLAIAERCAFRMTHLRPSLPPFPLPPGVTADEYLGRLVEQGAAERWGSGRGTKRLGTMGESLGGRHGGRTDAHDTQLTHELQMIAKLGLAGFFLIVWDVVRFARRQGILCQGRGSAANSAVCYCLGITAVDPVKMHLLFERFLSEERREAPDIDLDIAHRDREIVLQYVYERYGREHAAMVCEQITYRERSAVRDAARVLGLRGVRVEGRRQRGTANPEPPSALPPQPSTLVASIVAALQQLPRHRSIHVGGFVLTEEPLSTVVPIEPASMADRTVIQWEKDDLDPVGLVKIDLLGLGMLTLIQDCLLYIRRTRGVTIDLAALDMTDQAVYDDMCAADTIGVFQIESRAQMSTLPRLKPRCFYDLVVEVALIRPGPIQGDMVHPYLRRRAGEEPVTYPHPSLEPILARTLGIPLFQEQGMQVAIAAAGFTPGEADTLRRAMGHKRSHERMAAICERLIIGMRNNGIAEETALRIYNQINAFADYGFPESHAASFALIVYASAYLKHYYAPEFTAAILNAQPMGFYAPGTLIEDAQRHGVVVRPVDLTRSAWDATLEGTTRTTPAVRLGIRSVRGLGPKARDRLERALTDGPFTSVEDVVRRSGLDRRSLRLLAECGAFDAMFPGEEAPKRRRAALWEMLETLRGTAGPLAPTPPPTARVRLPAMSPLEITEADYRVTGLSLNGHPMQHLRRFLTPKGVRSAREVLASRDGDRVTAAGLVICRQRPGTAKGFVFLTLEDETGLVNVVVTPKRFERDGELIETTPLLVVGGRLQVEHRVVNLRGEWFRALGDQAGAGWAGRHDFH
jgi:error-prone DNA polymerase